MKWFTFSSIIMLSINVCVFSASVSLFANGRLSLTDLEQMLQYLYHNSQDQHRLVYEVIEYEKEVPQILAEYMHEHPSLHKLAQLLESKKHIQPRYKAILVYYFVIDFYLDDWLQAIFEGDFATGYALYESVRDELSLSSDVKEMLEFNEETIPLIRLFTNTGLLKAAYVTPFLNSAKKQLHAALRKNLEHIVHHDLALAWQVYISLSDNKPLPITALHDLKQEPEGNALLNLINNEGLLVTPMREQVITAMNALLQEKLGRAYAQRDELKKRTFAAHTVVAEPATGSTSP